MDSGHIEILPIDMNIPLSDGLTDLLFFILGVVVSFTITAYFSETFRLPTISRKYQIFPPGDYLVIGPSRELNGLVTWKATVNKRFLRSSKLRMYVIWGDELTDQTGEKFIWEYEGPIVKKNRFVVAKLDIKHHKEHKFDIDGQTVKTAFTDTDPSFLTFHASTQTWTIQPGVMSGFSAVHGSCYAAVHILLPANVYITEEQKQFLFGDSGYHADYLGIKDRVSSFSGAHGAPRIAPSSQ